MLPPAHEGIMDADAWAPEEHLRRALIDLQQAQRDYIAAFQRGEAITPDDAARDADAARAQAQRWGSLVRASARLDGDAHDEP